MSEAELGDAAARTRSIGKVASIFLGLSVVVLSVVGALLLGVGADAAPTCTRNFTGPAGGAWETAANWSPVGVPTTSDYACSAAGKSITLNSGLQSVDGVQLLGSLTVQGGELHTGASASTIGSLALAGGTVSGSATVTGSLDWQGGALQRRRHHDARCNRGLHRRVSIYHFIDTGHTLANQGTLTWNTGDVDICDASSTFQNAGTLTLDDPGGYTVRHRLPTARPAPLAPWSTPRPGPSPPPPPTSAPSTCRSPRSRGRSTDPER